MFLGLDPIIELALTKNASDILLQAGQTPVIRIAGKLFSVDGAAGITMDESDPAFKALLTENQHSYFMEHGSVDFAYSYNADNRLRANVFRRKNGLSVSLRLINNHKLDFESLDLPPFFEDIAEQYKQGFFLIVGPTGHGKSTSLASILNYINQSRSEHIITIEDPIEFVIENNKSVIEQREVGAHNSSFDEALRGCMRQDPDIIIIGEMRDHETMQAAITLAETGYLVFSTMHTNNSVQTIDRIVDAFPEANQKQVRSQLASTLTGVISQRLIPGVEGGLVLAYEQLFLSDAVRNIIRGDKIEDIYNAMQASGDSGFVRLEKTLSELAKAGKITKENSLSYAVNKELVEFFETH